MMKTGNTVFLIKEFLEAQLRGFQLSPPVKGGKFKIHQNFALGSLLMKGVMHKAALIVAILFPFFLTPANSFASNPVEGAKAAGMGTAFVAVADDPSAIAHNPAGLVQLKGTNIYGGTTFVIPSTTYTSPSGQSEDTEFQVFFPPHIYFSSDFGMKDMRFGVGIYSPFGIGGAKWSKEGLTRYNSTESMIATLAINPSFAYQVLPSLSIGIGLNYMVSRTQAKRMVDQSVFGADDGEIILKGIGDGWGYNFGLFFTPHERLSIGFAYRSRIKVTHNGDIEFKHIAPALQASFGGSDFETDMHTSSTFPEDISFGIAYRPSEKLTFAFDAEWEGWSSFKSAELDLEDEVPSANFTDSSAPLDWKDAWLIKFGAEYRLNESLALRGGYVYVETYVPDHTLDAANPSAVQHNFAIGLGYKVKKLVIDFFYNAGFHEDRNVKNEILSGKYENFIHSFGFSIGKKF
jgi:long-chain fatty acid transport protein